MSFGFKRILIYICLSFLLTFLYITDDGYNIVLYIFSPFINVVNFLSSYAERVEEIVYSVAESTYICAHTTYFVVDSCVNYSRQIDTAQVLNAVLKVIFYMILPMLFLVIVVAYRCKRQKLKRLEEKNSLKICCICLTELSNVLLLPCKHLCICETCIQLLKEIRLKEAHTTVLNCPMCRSLVQTELKVFFWLGLCYCFLFKENICINCLKINLCYCW